MIHKCLEQLREICETGSLFSVEMDRTSMVDYIGLGSDSSE